MKFQLIEPESSSISTMLGGTATVSCGGVGLSSVQPLWLFSLHVAAVAARACGNIRNGADKPATRVNASTIAAGLEARMVWRVLNMAVSPCGFPFRPVASVGGLGVEGALHHAHGVLGAAGGARGDAEDVDVEMAGAAVVGTGDAGLMLRTGARRLHQAHVLDEVLRVFRNIRGGQPGGKTGSTGAFVGNGPSERKPAVVCGAELRNRAARRVQRGGGIVFDATGTGVDGGGRAPDAPLGAAQCRVAAHRGELRAAGGGDHALLQQRTG